MSDNPDAAIAAAMKLLDELAREGGPACGAARILPEHRQEAASQLAALGPNVTPHTARRWVVDYEGIAASRFISLNGRKLPLKPVSEYTAEERLALGNWQESLPKQPMRPTKTTEPLPDSLRTAPAEVRLAWANAQARANGGQ